MKKTFILVSALTIAGHATKAQSQRFCIVEHYTQASCGPCAQANPGFQTLMTSNASKVIGIRYQVSWPGTDPMNAQDASEIATRTNYYSINGVPDEYMDGTINNVTSSTINTEYAVVSPYTITLHHSFNAANDSIFISAVITATQAFTATGALKLQVAMLEKQITFTNAPGSNGEKVFYNVLRKMYPNASGTTLPGTWTVGQSQTVTLKGKIPTYIYQKSQIATVAWIQDDGNKKIKQAAYSPTANTTGIDEVNIDYSAVAYPNPSNGVFNASFESSKPDNYSVKIINTLGQVVYQEALSNFSGIYSKQIDISAHGSGVYLFVISNGKNESIKKLITY